MKPGRIASAFVDLDPVDVIRDKDQKSRQAASSRRHGGRASMSATGRESAASELGTTRQEESGKPSGSMEDGGQRSALSTLPLVEESSQLAGTAHRAGATEHAIPNSRQTGSNGDSTLSCDNGLEREHAAIPTSNPGVKRSSKMATGLNHETPAALEPPENSHRSDASVNNDSVIVLNDSPKPKRTRRKSKTSLSSNQESSLSSRPKRPSRKINTLRSKTDVDWDEVDWDEDLRPTDDESSKAENAHQVTSVSSQDPEYRSSADARSPPKRKRGKSPSESSKSRKAARGKGKTAVRGNEQNLQLPLTSKPPAANPGEAFGSHANSSSRPLDGQSERTVTQATTVTPGTSLPHTAERPEEKQSQSVTQEHEVIEISSRSSLTSNSPSSEDEIDQPKGGSIRTTKAKTQGRGKTVGQKLVDALRDTGVSSRPTMETLSHSARVSEAAFVKQKPNSPGLHVGPSSISTRQDSRDSEPSVEQVEQAQSTPVAARQGQVEPMTTQLTSVDTTVHKEPPAEIETPVHAGYMDLEEPMGLQGLFGSQASTNIEADGHVVSSRWTTLGSHPRTNSASEHVVMNPAERTDDDQREVQAISNPFGSEADLSSQNSAAAKTDPLAQGNDTDHTPESQKPLLTKNTTLRPNPVSIPRSMIVDDYGSPRLVAQAKGEAKEARFYSEIGCPQGTEMTEPSSSDYDQGSEEDCSNYTPESQRAWSKFHRDIVSEYGIEAEDLIRRRSRTVPFKKDIRSDTAVRETGPRANLPSTEQLSETKPAMGSPRRIDGTSTFEASTGSVDPEHALARAPSSSQQAIDKIRMRTGQHPEGHRHEKQVPAETPQDQLGPEPSRSLVQDDTDTMEWISALQAAQKSAHSLLLETNQVSRFHVRL